MQRQEVGQVFAKESKAPASARAARESFVWASHEPAFHNRFSRAISARRAKTIAT
jgi:hypothetical protein